MTERAPRDRCRLPAPSWCLDGRVAASVDTAARMAAADSGLPRGRRALSGALHSDAQACATELEKRRLPSASLVPRPDSPPTASSDERVVPRTASPQTGHHDPKIPTKKTTRRNHQHTQLGVLHALIVLLASCSALLRVPAGSFEKRGVTHSQPSRPLPSRRAGAEGIVTWPKPREIHSPKMRPLLHMTFDL